MYRTCLYCKRDLGSNEVLEMLPAGRRVAFDAARGRLWVVCPHCARWSLTPLEDRWETIESCERLYRGTRLRLGTDEISLAHLPSGLELVRVGRPLRPELAAWRFAGHLPGSLERAGRWLYRQLTRTVIGPSRILHQIPRTLLAIRYIRQDDVPRVLWRPPGDGRPWGVERQLLDIEPDLPAGATSLHAEILPGQRFRGEERLRVAGLALTELNRGAATPLRVRHALEWLDTFGNPFGSDDVEGEGLLAPDGPASAESPALRHSTFLADLDPAVRLAMEMASHEVEERRFMQGELWRLERAWRDAEEVAAIADSLTIPEWVSEWLGRGRRSEKGEARSEK